LPTVAEVAVAIRMAGLRAAVANNLRGESATHVLKVYGSSAAGEHGPLEGES